MEKPRRLIEKGCQHGSVAALRSDDTNDELWSNPRRRINERLAAFGRGGIFMGEK